MSLLSYRLWYFEVHQADQSRHMVDNNGRITDAAGALQSAFLGTQDDAHTEADRRYSAYEQHGGQPFASAMSFSPACTLSVPSPI